MKTRDDRGWMTDDRGFTLGKDDFLQPWGLSMAAKARR